MIKQSTPVHNGGIKGSILSLFFNSAMDNGKVQQTVVQNGNPSAAVYPGIMIDSRNSLSPFTLSFGPAPSLDIEVNSGQFFQRQIPAIPEMTITLTWTEPSSPIASGTNGPVVYLLPYEVNSADFTVIGGTAGLGLFSIVEGFSETIYNGSGVLTGYCITANITNGAANFEIVDGLNNSLWLGTISALSGVYNNLAWTISGLDIPFFNDVIINVTGVFGAGLAGSVSVIVYVTPS